MNFAKYRVQLSTEKSTRVSTSTSTSMSTPSLLSKRPKIGFQYQLSLNAGQRYCRMLPLDHSVRLSTFIKLPIVIKIYVLSIFELPFYTGFTVVLGSRLHHVCVWSPS